VSILQQSLKRFFSNSPVSGKDKANARCEWLWRLKEVQVLVSICQAALNRPSAGFSIGLILLESGEKNGFGSRAYRFFFRG
jgi:hypothetical protein